jgi:hypothetical protein
LFSSTESLALEQDGCTRTGRIGKNLKLCRSISSFFLSFWPIQLLRAFGGSCSFAETSGSLLEIDSWHPGFFAKPGGHSFLQFRRSIGRGLPWFAACAVALLRIVEWRWVAKLPILLPILIGSASLVRGLQHLYKGASEARMTDVRAPVLILGAFRDDGIRRDFEFSIPTVGQ